MNGPKTEWSPVGKLHKETAQLYADLFAANYSMIAEAIKERLDKAVIICSTVGACRRTEDLNVFLVESCAKKHTYYEVDVKKHTCSCPDFANAPAHLCKHRLAIGLHLCGPGWLEHQVQLQIAACHKEAKLYATYKPANCKVQITEVQPKGMVYITSTMSDFPIVDYLGIKCHCGWVARDQLKDIFVGD